MRTIYRSGRNMTYTANNTTYYYYINASGYHSGTNWGGDKFNVLRSFQGVVYGKIEVQE